MSYAIKNTTTLNQILRLDFLLGSTTAIIGLAFFSPLSPILGLSSRTILRISVITLLYAIVAYALSTQRFFSIPLLRTLIYANWTWTAISTILLFFHFATATALGLTFLILQIFVVGGLAYLEGKQLNITKDKLLDN